MREEGLGGGNVDYYRSVSSYDRSLLHLMRRNKDNGKQRVGSGGGGVQGGGGDWGRIGSNDGKD